MRGDWWTVVVPNHGGEFSRLAVGRIGGFCWAMSKSRRGVAVIVEMMGDKILRIQLII